MAQGERGWQEDSGGAALFERGQQGIAVIAGDERGGTE